MESFKRKKYTSTDIIITALLFIVVAIIPLVTKLSTVPLRADEVNAIRTGTGYNDVFSNVKSILIMCVGVTTALFIGFDAISGDEINIDWKSFPVVTIGIFAILSILSALFSSYKSVAFMGATERYEGLFVWLCYIVFFIAALVFSMSKDKARTLMWCLVFSGLFLGIIGLLQVLNVPVYENKFISKLIMGSQYSGNNLAIKFDSVFATLYNPNCAGVYFGMMTSLFAVLAITLPKNDKLKYVSIIVAILTLISTVGSNSVGGFLGLACGIVIAIIVGACYFIFKKKSKSAIIASIAVVIVAIVAAVLFLNSNAAIAQKVKIIYSSISNGTMSNESSNFYKDIEIDGKSGKVITANGVYEISADGENSKLLHDGTELVAISNEAANKDGGVHKKFTDNDLTFDLYLYDDTTSDGSAIFNISLVSTDSTGNDKYFMFGQKADGTVTFLDKFGNPVDLSKEIPHVGFEGIERLGSNRGYIWSRSLPLIKNNLIIGSGPDTFVFEFPQQDVQSKLNFLNDPYVIIDKPHNMYLQYAINTGLLSLIVLIILFAGYIIQTIKSILNDDDTFTIAIKLGLLSAVVSYLASGFTTDSVVSVAPVFWVILGIGYGVNLIGKQILTKEERKLNKLRKKFK